MNATNVLLRLQSSSKFASESVCTYNVIVIVGSECPSIKMETEKHHVFAELRFHHFHYH